MDHQLAESIIATFRPKDPTSHCQTLSKFDYGSWKSIYSWLDASGLALYFLDRLQDLGIEASIPPIVLHRLQTNAADNKAKTSRLFTEFMLINREFKKVGLSYLNLKGFTLAPDAFREATLRLQLDLDFWVDRADLSKCQEILQQLGYSLVGEGHNVKEFKADSENLPMLTDLYKARLQRCVEVHFGNLDEGHDGIGDDHRGCAQSTLKSWEGLELPLLGACNRFIALALHLFKHLKGEWTRASWLLEYANFINFNEHNDALWEEVRQRTTESEQIRIAVGVATSVAQRNFSVRHLPEALLSTMHELPPTVRLWLELYGRKVVFARFPGTKLYLFLYRALAFDKSERCCEIKKLIPLHRPPRITGNHPNRHLFFDARRIRDEGYFFVSRFWFHAKQGCYYMIESLRWSIKVSRIRTNEYASEVREMEI